MAAVRKRNSKTVEQYEHKDKERVNNPPVGLVTPETDRDTGKKKYAYDPHIDPALQFDSQRSEIEKVIDQGLVAESLGQAKAALAELKKRQEAYLNWAGKAVCKQNGNSQQQLSLFESADENPPLRNAIEFYQHKHNWSNRLIAGDSLLVMNSLLEKEGLAGHDPAQSPDERRSAD